MENFRDEVIGGFAAELRNLRSAAGEPSYRALEEASRKRGGVQLSRATISDVLIGKRAPTWEFVVAFVKACAQFAEEHGHEPMENSDLDRWRARYQQLIADLGQEPGATARSADRVDESGLQLDGPFLSKSQETALGQLMRIARDARQQPSKHAAVILISGPAGVGKTTLAMRFGLLAGGDFPDGVYRLSVAHPDLVPIGDAVGDILAGLGVAGGDLPAQADERCTLLRSLMASRQILLIIDDVRQGEDVQLLLPSRGNSSLTVLISRMPLTGFSASEIVPLGPLNQEDSVALLREFIGEARFASDSRAAAEVARLCDGLPLALRIVAGVITGGPFSVAELAELADKLRAADAHGVSSTMDRVFAEAYTALSPAAATVLRRLCLTEDSVEIPAHLVAFLVGDQMPAEEVATSLTELTNHGLLTNSPDGSRIMLHDKLRQLGRDRARVEESAEQVALILDRADRLIYLALGYHPQPQPLIVSDFWTLKDCLSYAHYADAIAEFIRHRQTLPPLTIGLKAPWGAGKTSLMRMIQNNLDPQHDGKPCRLQLDVAALGSRSQLARLLARRRRNPDVGINNLDILRQVNAADDASGHADADAAGTTAEGVPSKPLKAQLADGTPVNASTWRPTVWFNPWMYQNGEQTWAGLAYEIISQVTGRLKPVDRELFWLLLNLARVDTSAVRRRWYRLLAERVLPWVLIWAVALTLTFVALLMGQLIAPLRDTFRYLSAGLFGVGTVGLLAGGTSRVLSFVNRNASGPLSVLVRKPDVLSSSQQFLGGQVNDAFDQVVPDPGYAARLGFLHLVHTDMQRVLNLIATPERPLVVFVDDLDRCSPGTVSQVIEAINLFLAGQFPNCIFVLGMEPGTVAAHIETAYPDLVQAERDGRLPGDWSTLGWRFLEKVVQLPLNIPLRTEDEVASYLYSLMRFTVPRAGRSPIAEIGPHDTGAERLAPVQMPERETNAAAATPASIIAAGTSQQAQVEGIENAIRARQPTPDTLRRVALEAQREILGISDPILPATLTAAGRIFAILYSDTDAFATLKDSLPLLASRNPREIKRFVNLFRFYSFISDRRRLIGGDVPSEEQIAKVAALAIRWPQVVSMLGSNGTDANYLLKQLESAARDDDQKLWEKTVRESFPMRPFPVAPASDADDSAAVPLAFLGWREELRRFLGDGVEIGSVVSQFI